MAAFLISAARVHPTGIIRPQYDTTASNHRASMCKAIYRSVDGTWKKDPQKSESMKETADLFKLSFLAHKGAGLLRLLRIHDTDEHFATSVNVRPRVENLNLSFLNADALTEPMYLVASFSQMSYSCWVMDCDVIAGVMKKMRI
jgi:hypothetical protein